MLARRLFPAASPARRLASVWAANRGRNGDWEVDLASVPLRVRAGAGEPWEPVEPLTGPLSGAVPVSDLTPAAALRLRTLGGERARVTVGPLSSARILVALPAGAEFSSVSGVQWGETELSRIDVSLRDFHALREDPGGVRDTSLLAPAGDAPDAPPPDQPR